MGAYGDLVDGESRYYLGAFVNSQERTTSGIPFFFEWSQDVPPYDLDLVLWIADSPTTSTIAIDAIKIMYDDNASPVVQVKQPLVSDLEKEVPAYGENIFIARFKVPNAIKTKSDVVIKISVSCESSNKRKKFQVAQRVTVVEEFRVYPGWLKLLALGRIRRC